MKISYATGTGFSLVRNNVSVYFNLEKEDVIDLVLQPGDILLTEDNTFLDILFLSDESILYIAENTTFVIENVYPEGGGFFNLVYGRIRAKVQTISGNSQFAIRGQDTVAGVRGTDFGFDQIYDLNNPESERVSKVYCFEGSVEVSKIAGDEYNKMTSENESIVIRENQMTEYSSSQPAKPLDKISIEDEIYLFWDIPLENDEETSNFVEIQEPVLEYEEPLVAEVGSNQLKMRQVGGIMFAIGSVALSGSLVYYALSPESDKDFGVAMSGFSASICFIGTSFFATSYLIPPNEAEEFP